MMNGVNGRLKKPHATPIAVFDSGVGGLSVLHHLIEYLPNENIIYFADQANIPYGSHPLKKINQFCHEITRFLLSEGAKCVVVACNTASAAALSKLRQQFPQIPFIGMEPAVKPAASNTKSQVVGVMATAGTFASERYAALMAAYAKEIQVLEDPCLGLVDLIEAGHFDTVDLKALLMKIITPMCEAGMDTLVLGCTHYPFVQTALREIVGEDVAIINPAPAVAQQTKRVLEANGLLLNMDERPLHRFITSGAVEPFQEQLAKLIRYVGSVETAVWQDGGVVLSDNNKAIVGVKRET